MLLSTHLPDLSGFYIYISWLGAALLLMHELIVQQVKLLSTVILISSTFTSQNLTNFILFSTSILSFPLVL